MPAPITRRKPAGRDAAAAYREQRFRRAQNGFYSSARWRRLRQAHLTANPICLDCEQAGRTTPAAHVHHIKPVETHPALALDPSNLQSLCVPCHNARETR